MKFNIINEKSEFKLGNILTVFMLPNSDKPIALFTAAIMAIAFTGLQGLFSGIKL